jgi:CDP-6-deoxy-D-xylo-4-hexulose-3-dehydrase
LPFGYDHKFVFSEFGYNLKSTNPQAALGIKQLERIEEFAIIRKRNFRLLMDGLGDWDLVLPKSLIQAEPSWFGFPILLPEDRQRKPIVDYLNTHGVQTRFLFAGNITKQPMFTQSKRPFRIVGDLQNTDTVMNQMFWIGLWHGLAEEDIAYEINTLGKALR